MEKFYIRCVFGLVTLALIWGLAHDSSAQARGGDARTQNQKAAQTATATQEETLERVPVIVEVKYAIQASLPPNLLVTAHGKVPTEGWSKVQ